MDQLKNKYLNKRQNQSFFYYLKINNISKIKFFMNYWLIITKSVRLYWWQYFRYLMLLIWRRTFLIWTAILAFIYEIKITNIIENIKPYNIYDKIYNIFIDFDYGKFNYIIYFFISFISIIIIKYICIYVYKIYKFLFIYRDIKDFNYEIKKFYIKELTDFFEKNKNIQKENIKLEDKNSKKDKKTSKINQKYKVFKIDKINENINKKHKKLKFE